MKNNKLHFIISVDHIIDIITNSSSELFIIENKHTPEILAAMVNDALVGFTHNVTPDDFEHRFKKDSNDMYSQQYEIDAALELFPDEEREQLREKYFTSPKYYAISFDRDRISSSYVDVRGKLAEIGFELIDTDY